MYQVPGTATQITYLTPDHKGNALQPTIPGRLKKKFQLKKQMAYAKSLTLMELIIWLTCINVKNMTSIFHFLK